MKTAPRSSSPDARIATRLFFGHPVTTRAALREVYVGRDAIAARLADGRMDEIWSGTLLVGVHAIDASTDLIQAAAIATTGPGSALDGLSALDRRGLWTRHDGSIHVASPRMRRPVPGYRVRFHRTCTSGMRANTIRGLPTRVAIEALFMAAAMLTPHQLANVLKRAAYAREFSLEDVDRQLVKRAGERGVATVRRAVELRRSGSAGTKIASEDELLPHAWRAFGEPLVNVYGAAGIADYEPDMCWPERRLIVEVDGDQHIDDPVEREKDAWRDALLRSTGWLVVRVPYREIWRNVDAVIAHVARALAER